MLAGASWTHAWASQSPPAQPMGKSRICVIFTGTPAPEDRDWGADNNQVKAMKTRLAKAEKDLGNVELIMGQSNDAQQTADLLEKANVLAAGQRPRLDVSTPLAPPGTSRYPSGQQ